MIDLYRTLRTAIWRGALYAVAATARTGVAIAIFCDAYHLT